MASRIDAVLETRTRPVDAARRPTRCPPRWAGARVLVDIRPAAQRAREGEVPAALVIERNVLEWRCDPTSDARLPRGRRRRRRMGGAVLGGLHVEPGRRRAAGPRPAPRHRRRSAATTRSRRPACWRSSN